MITETLEAGAADAPMPHEPAPAPPPITKPKGKAKAKPPSDVSLTFDRALLSGALARIKTISERKSTIPIFQNVMFEVGHGPVRLRGTSTDAEISVSVEAGERSGHGSFTAPVHMLGDIIRKLPDKPITLSFEAGRERLSVKSGRATFTLPTLPADDFPTWPDMTGDAEFDINGGEFQRLLERTSHAMSSEVTRYYLCGIFLTITPERLLEAVATDGHRIATARTALPDELQERDALPPVIIPKTIVPQLMELAGTAGTLSVTLSDKRLVIEAGSTIISTKLVDGTYPDYRAVMPRPSMIPNQTHFARAELLSAVDRVTAVVSEKARAVKLCATEKTLRIEGKGLVGDLFAEANEEIDAESTPDITGEIGFNGKYMAEALKTLTGDKAVLMFGESNTAALLESPGDEDITLVLMPMRV